MSANAPVFDARYYQVAGPRSLGERVLVWARDRIYRDFMTLVAPSPDDRILDVGVSDVVNDGANLLERLYPHPENITGAGLGDGVDFRAAYPGIGYQKIGAGEPLPFANDSFEVAVSNAVIEHVGSRAAQAAFVAEMARVAKSVFIIAPNRWFPIEHHTALPLAHFHPASFAAACKLTGKTQWLDQDELILTGLEDLRAAAPAGRAVECGYTGLRLWRFSSNAYLVVKPAPTLPDHPLTVQ
jgi:hypothetical protein